MVFDYYYGTQADQFIFIKIPKLLITDEIFDDLSLPAKVLYASKDDVMYAATHYRNGEIPNESAIKMTVDYQSYKEAQDRCLHS